MAFLAVLGLQKEADNKILMVSVHIHSPFVWKYPSPPPPPNFYNLSLINQKQSKYRAFSWSLMTQGIESLTLTDH